MLCSVPPGSLSTIHKKNVFLKFPSHLILLPCSFSVSWFRLSPHSDDLLSVCYSYFSHSPTGCSSWRLYFSPTHRTRIHIVSPQPVFILLTHAVRCASVVYATECTTKDAHFPIHRRHDNLLLFSWCLRTEIHTALRSYTYSLRTFAFARFLHLASLC